VRRELKGKLVIKSAVSSLSALAFSLASCSFFLTVYFLRFLQMVQHPFPRLAANPPFSILSAPLTLAL